MIDPFPPLDQLKIAAVEFLDPTAPWFKIELRIAHGRLIEHYVPIPLAVRVTNATTTCSHDILHATGTETELQARYPDVIFSFDRLYGVDEYLPLFLPVNHGTMPPALDSKIFGRFKLNPFNYRRLDPDLPDPIHNDYYYTPRKKSDSRKTDNRERNKSDRRKTDRRGNKPTHPPQSEKLDEA